ncbi:hypothetical protein [Azospirillum isscasi]|uniref:TIGR02588 family protein n=1 Tax=Azospirillum isscasi TaxID=3053926 RepID=A0ABU0WKC8_9PROT|nr:hypothetical protein [Azospirillum isscasi]MDQ2104684.1 hypothetical protein [Azospirillum isscasi]
MADGRDNHAESRAESQLKSRAESWDGDGSASVSRLAWIASGLGLLLFLGSVGVLGYEGVTRGNGAPAISAELEEVVPAGSRWLAHIRVGNDGGTTGAKVQVEGQLMAGAEALETSVAEFDYVPAGSHQRGGLFFDRDPRAHELRLRVLGYVEP